MTSLLEQLQSSFPSTYALEREVGRGGMATVFLARDVRYDRKVAVKVLSPELGAVLGVERFLSEIRVTATLQHPNLLPLFDSGESNGLLYYVMPFVEGETLRARLDREKQLSVSETVRLGSAIASALDYAHRNGVIHRDLKPENILLQDGQPLVADFGIALAVSNAGGTRVTQTGLSLGTPQYMSPEQATGDRVIDARSDVYALGAILYECLTGEPPHTGTTAQAIIARLMTEEPRAIAATRKNVPVHVEAAIGKALEKLPADRWATTKEMADALQDPARTSPSQSSGGAVSSTRPSSGRWFGVAGLACGIVGAGTAAWTATRPPEVPDVKFAVELPDSVQAEAAVGLSVAISPDGQTIAFIGRSPADPTNATSVYVRRLADLQPRLLPSTTGAANPVFSSDGTSIIFSDNTNGDFSQVSVAGGAPTSVSKPVGGWLGNAWGNGESFIYANYTSLIRMSRDGRTHQVIASTQGLSPKIVALTNPAILPDGKTVAARAIIGGSVGGVGKLAIASVDSGPLTVVDLEIANVVGYRDGVLFFGRLDGTVSAVAIDLAKRTVSGAPQIVLDGISSRTEGGVNAMMSASGTMVYLLGSNRKQLIVSDAQGKTLHTSSEQGFLSAPRWSMDGTRIAVERRPLKAFAAVLGVVWLYDPTATLWSQLVEQLSMGPRWLPDGKRVAFRSDPPAARGLQVVPIDGSAPPRPLAPPMDYQPSFFPDGRAMIVARDDSSGRRSRLVRIPLDSPNVATELLATTANGRAPEISPDGKWVAYLAVEEQGTRVMVRSTRPDGGQVPVSVSPDASSPRWGKRSNALYFTEGRIIRRARLNFTGTTPVVVARDSVLSMPSVSEFDVTPDEQRFVFVREGIGRLRPVIVTRWADSVVAKVKGATR